MPEQLTAEVRDGLQQSGFETGYPTLGVFSASRLPHEDIRHLDIAVLDSVAHVTEERRERRFRIRILNHMLLIGASLSAALAAAAIFPVGPAGLLRFGAGFLLGSFVTAVISRLVRRWQPED